MICLNLVNQVTESSDTDHVWISDLKLFDFPKPEDDYYCWHGEHTNVICINCSHGQCQHEIHEEDKDSQPEDEVSE